MIAERMPLFNGRLISDVDNCRPEPSTMTDTPKADWRGAGRKGYWWLRLVSWFTVYYLII